MKLTIYKLLVVTLVLAFLGAVAVFYQLAAHRNEPRVQLPGSQKRDLTPEQATPLVTPDLSKAELPKGILLKEVDRFWERWHLVTTRYRSDNAELRFVFANDTAWKALQTRQSVYPPGSIFGKVAMNSVRDAAFPVSVETQYVERIQLMKKMPSGFGATRGWNYALYVGVNKKFDENDVMACVACHDMVPERDYVFSRPSFLRTNSATLSRSLKQHFEKKQFSELQESVQTLLHQIQPNLDGPIQVRSMPLFAGSFSESFAPLAQLAAESKRPYVLLDSRNERRLMLAITLPQDPSCQHKVGIWGAYQDPLLDTTSPPNAKVRLVENGTYCDGKIEWNVRLPISITE